MLTIIVLYTELYSEIAFDFHIHDDPQIELDKIDLPSPVKAVEMSGRPEKLYFHDLEVCFVTKNTTLMYTSLN